MCFSGVVGVCTQQSLARSLSLCVSQNHQKKNYLQPLNFSVLINIIIVINRRLSQQHKKKASIDLTVLSRQNCCSSSIIIKQASLDTHIYLYSPSYEYSQLRPSPLPLTQKAFIHAFFFSPPLFCIAKQKLLWVFSPSPHICILVALLFSSCLPVVLFTSFIPLLLFFLFTLTCCCCFFFFGLCCATRDSTWLHF